MKVILSTELNSWRTPAPLAMEVTDSSAAALGSPVGGPPRASLLQNIAGADADWEDADQEVTEQAMEENMTPEVCH